MCARKSKFPYPHSSHPGFTVIFTKTSDQSRFKEDQRNAMEIPESAQIYQNNVGNRGENALFKRIELRADNPWGNDLRN